MGAQAPVHRTITAAVGDVVQVEPAAKEDPRKKEEDREADPQNDVSRMVQAVVAGVDGVRRLLKLEQEKQARQLLELQVGSPCIVPPFSSSLQLQMARKSNEEMFAQHKTRLEHVESSAMILATAQAQEKCNAKMLEAAQQREQTFREGGDDISNIIICKHETNLLHFKTAPVYPTPRCHEARSSA